MKVLLYKYFPLLLIVIILGFSANLFSQNNRGDNNQIINVGVYDNPPKIFLNDKGQPDGVFIDVIKEIGAKENLQFKYHFDTWDHLYKKLQTGEIDVLPDVVYSVERDSLFSLNDIPVLTSWLELFARSDLKLNTVLDLENKRVGVLKGSIQEKVLKDFINKKFSIKFKTYTFKNYTNSVQALKNKEIDVIVADRFFAFSSLFDKSIKPTGIVIRPSGLHFGFTKNRYPKLVVLFDKNISALRNDADSKYYKSLFKWLERDVKTFIPSYIKWAIFAIISILIISLSFLLLLRKSVRIKTKQLYKSQKKAVEGESKLKLIADNLVSGIIYQVVTLDIEKRKFNYVSDNVIKFYGCTASQVLEDPNLIYSRIHPDDIHIMKAAEVKAIESMTNFVVEVRVLNPDNSIRWVYSVAKPRIVDGLICWDGIEFDISERKQLEIDLEIAKDKAEESDRLKSTFLANMSHEIRTPMNGILGFADLLKEPNLKGKKKQKYIRIIEESGLRMLNIINDIINISKIESGQMELHLEESNVNEQLEYIFTFFTPEAEKKGIQLLYKKALAFDDAFTNTDREKVFAILTNLVKNAINHTVTGSVEFGYTHNDKFLEFYVKDTGIGVPKDRQEAIFERFIQADVTNKMAMQGAGLGLSISKAYVEMLGGKLWLESEEGKGSTFFFTLPFYNKINKKKLIKREFQSSIEVVSIPQLNILIAEDDKISQILISKIVKDFTKKIIIVGNGLEAVKACQNNLDIDLILMDVQMPEMNGYEAILEIRKFNSKVIIIAQSAGVLPVDKEKAIELGANDYITKPINIEMLKQIISRNFKK